MCGVYGAGSSCRYGTRRGACPVGRRFYLPFRHPAGGLPSLSPVYPAFCLLSCPHPPHPLPRRGRGRFLLFYCKGLRPLHPRGWTGRGTGSAGVGGARRGLARLVAGSTCRSGTRRGACPVGRRFYLPFQHPAGACPVGRRITLPFRHPAGGLPSLSPVYPAFCLLSCPHPPNPLPGGKGETQSLFRRGRSPRHPGTEPLAALTEPAKQVPSGGELARRCRLPPPPSPAGWLAFFVACLPCL